MDKTFKIGSNDIISRMRVLTEKPKDAKKKKKFAEKVHNSSSG